ncbi:MAG: hypothetical protein L6R35_007117, partial [Caloplaca aegaea]
MAKARAFPTLQEIEKKLGYKVDSLDYPNKNTDFFYLDLRQIPESVYWKTVREFEEYERRAHCKDKRTTSERALLELGLVH